MVTTVSKPQNRINTWKDSNLCTHKKQKGGTTCILEIGNPFYLELHDIQNCSQFQAYKIIPSRISATLLLYSVIEKWKW